MNALASLGAEIRREHEAATGKARDALTHARRAGELLAEAKAQLARGAWLPWLAERCAFSARTAQAYMRLAAHWPALEAIRATAAHMTLRGALAALADGGNQIAERFTLLAADAAGDDSDESLHARLAALTEDAAAVLEATTSAAMCDRIADAARQCEEALARRRLDALRMLGRVKAFDAAVEKAFTARPEASAFVSTKDAKGRAFLVASTLQPGRWHYATLEFSGGRTMTPVLTRSVQPIPGYAIATMLAEFALLPVGAFKPCRREALPIASLWPGERVA